MATQETQIIDDIIVSTRRKMLTLGGAALAGLAFGPTKAANAAALMDADILNFALNLEYLEANFYTLATSGQTIATFGLGVGTGTATSTGAGTVTVKPAGAAKCQVPFAMPAVQAYANETAAEERKHVTFLRGALGTAAVAQPNIDLYNSFITLGGLVGVANFDPFANDVYFLIGAYIFEDVGVTAYGGAVSQIQTTSTAVAAAGIHAVEAYHAGLVRTTINQLDPNNAAGYLTLTQKISAVRATLDGTLASASGAGDIGITQIPTPLNGAVTGQTGVTVADINAATSLDFLRTPAQVLSIVTGVPQPNMAAAPYQGVFFPNGLNGTIK